MLYIRNHPFTPSIDGQIITLRYIPCLPVYCLHVSSGTCLVGVLRHCLIHFHYCPFPTAHYHTVNWSKVILRIHTGYTINLTTSNHLSRPIVSCLANSYFYPAVGSTFRTPFSCSISFVVAVRFSQTHLTQATNF